MQKDAASDHDENRARDDVHLHSTKAVTGYQVHALDGTVGHISDFVVDDDTWAIREIVVQTGHWYASKHVRIAPRDIERLSYEQSTVFVLLSQDDIEGACENAMVTARNYNRKAFGLEE